MIINKFTYFHKSFVHIKNYFKKLDSNRVFECGIGIFGDFKYECECGISIFGVFKCEFECGIPNSHSNLKFNFFWVQVTDSNKDASFLTI